jgi:hypothetical protein
MSVFCCDRRGAICQSRLLSMLMICGLATAALTVGARPSALCSSPICRCAGGVGLGWASLDPFGCRRSQDTTTALSLVLPTATAGSLGLWSRLQCYLRRYQHRGTHDATSIV